MESIDIVLQRIKNGSSDLRQKFIEDNKDFIIRVVGNAFGKSAVTKNSDEFNLGLMAFNYSIDNFNIGSHHDFYEYAERNIKKSVRDVLIRSAQASSQSNGIFNDNCYNNNCELSEELSLFKNDLWKLGITLENLLASTPKNPHLIKRAVRLAKDLSNSNEFIKAMSSNRIEFGYIQADETDRKIIKENPKYVIALCLIMKSRLEIIKGYIKNVDLGWNLTECLGVILEIKGTKAVIMTEDCRFLSIYKPFNSSTGNEIRYKDYYKPNNKAKSIKYMILAGCTALFIIAGFLVFSPDNPISTDNKTLSEVNTEPDSGIVSDNTTDNDSGEGDHDSNNTISSESTPDTDTSLAGTKDDNDTKLRADKATSKLSTPKPVNKTTPGNAINDPMSGKDRNQVRDYPVRETKPATVIASTTPISATPSTGSKTTDVPIINTKAPSQSTQIKASGKPGNVLIISDKYNVRVGEDFILTSTMTGGNNGTEWTLFENGSVNSSMRRTDYTPDSQTVMRIITAEKPGTYSFKSVFTNSFGSSESSTIQVIVSE
ncbi:MAG TPA: anti-sigma factor domain-containing protein [Pseudobacteroides sp.]|uniref:anti-sigma factor domain-containing protein n=1 Tax=Pseudobacteroides sp. TaxID=1968840 RepID=UPI002F952D4D